ncbi:hypothetical protein A4X13_0g8863, partial [Tilletia indica]
MSDLSTPTPSTSTGKGADPASHSALLAIAMSICNSIESAEKLVAMNHTLRNGASSSEFKPSNKGGLILEGQQDWLTWRMGVRAVLVPHEGGRLWNLLKQDPSTSLEAYRYIYSTDNKPIPIEIANIYRKNDLSTLGGALIALCSKEVRGSIIDEDDDEEGGNLNGIEIWRKLVSDYGRTDPGAASKARKDIVSFELLNRTPQEAGNELRALFTQLKLAGGEAYTEAHKVNIALDVFSKVPRFSSRCSTIRENISTGSRYKFNDIISKMVGEDAVRASNDSLDGQSTGTGSSSTVVALSTLQQRIGASQGSGAQHQRQNGQIIQQQQPRCHHCDKTGHFISECRQKAAGKPPNPHGRVAKDRRFASNRSGSSQSHRQQVQQQQPINYSIYGQASAHVAQQDPVASLNHRMQNLEAALYGQNALLTRLTSSQPEPSGTGGTDEVALCSVNVPARGAKDASFHWIIDSGASVHMTPHRSLFQFLIPDQTPVKTANGKVLHAAGRGSILLVTTIPNLSELVLYNVLFVPDLEFNLVSVVQLLQDHMRVEFCPDLTVRITDSFRADYLVEASYSWTCQAFLLPVPGGTAFTMVTALISILSDDDDELEDVSSLEGSAIPQTSTHNDRSIRLRRLWHERLGHIGWSALPTLAKNSIGLPDLLSVLRVVCDCAVCSLTNIRRSPFPDSVTKTTRALELVHGDLTGRIVVKSLGGAEYLAILVDDFTRMTWGIPLARKSDFVSKFIEWRDEVVPFKGSIACLRT